MAPNGVEFTYQLRHLAEMFDKLPRNGDLGSISLDNCRTQLCRARGAGRVPQPRFRGALGPSCQRGADFVPRWIDGVKRRFAGCAGINRHVVANERVVQERRSESILAPNLAVIIARW
jgi:hypothetical protein